MFQIIMAELIIYKGRGRVTVRPCSDTCYLYRIGPGQVQGGDFINLNDERRLNVLAEEIRDAYCRWIYSLNELFLQARLQIDDLSLFFLTDLSCKRSEFFESYDLICSLLLIQERLKGIELVSARLIGVDSGFERAFQSLFPTTRLVTLKKARPPVTFCHRFGADIRYLFRVVGVVLVNTLNGRKREIQSQQHRKFFFSTYPQMFSKGGKEKKYGDFFGETDRYAVSILTDGMHQQVNLGSYRRFLEKAENCGYLVIDRFFRIGNVLSGMYWLCAMIWFFFHQKNSSYQFKKIDITGLIQVELLFSMSRIVRLCTFMGAFQRFLENTPIREIVYYPCEYPLGRMISYIVNITDPEIIRTGFQMGIASQRRLEQFLAPGEGAPNPPYLSHAPIPDQILAEDQHAARIYQYAGYQNVEIMKKIYRYAYLDSVKPELCAGWLLIAPGLHDGETILEQLQIEIESNPDNIYVVKPHPRADNRYISQYSGIDNIKVSNRPISELLGIVARVFVTYSSVGIEAKRLGLDVTVISVPGRVNTSPLLDGIREKGSSSITFLTP